MGALERDRDLLVRLVHLEGRPALGLPQERPSEEGLADAGGVAPRDEDALLGATVHVPLDGDAMRGALDARSEGPRRAPRPDARADEAHAADGEAADDAGPKRAGTNVVATTGSIR
ncbi:MAG: hypothetical protein R3B72_33610 [Polyangiaceae bacterium]